VKVGRKLWHMRDGDGELGGGSMGGGGGVARPWVVIREDDNGNRYSVGRYATRAEAEQVAARFEGKGHKQLYLVERVNGGHTEQV
jgi:hypothetical protein